MKKGLLSLLAVALTVVSCQNYDDQFQSLTDQITELSTTVQGLTALEAQVTALQNTVNGLATSQALAALAGVVNTNGAAITANGNAIADVAGDVADNADAVDDVADAVDAVDAAVDAVDTAVSDNADDIADVAGDIASIQASITAILEDLEDVATADDLDVISSTLAIVQADVKEILAGNATINQDITINNAATLEYAETLVGTETDDPNVIVNGQVTIDMTNIDAADLGRVNAVAAKFATILGDGTGAGATKDGLVVTSDSALTFTNLAFIDDNVVINDSAQDLAALRTISGGLTTDYVGENNYSQVTSIGAVVISNSVSATTVVFGDTATIASLDDATTSVGVVVFPNATNVSLGKAPVTDVTANKAGSITLKLTTTAGLDIEADAASTINLDALATATGALDIDATAATAINLGALTAGTSLNITATSTTDINAARLASLSAALTISDADDVNLDALASVTGLISVAANGTSDFASLTEITNAGANSIGGTVVTLTALAANSTGTLTLPDATAVLAPALVNGGTLTAASALTAELKSSAQADLVVNAATSINLTEQAVDFTIAASTNYPALTSLTVTGKDVSGVTTTDLAITAATTLTTVVAGGELSSITIDADDLTTLTTSGNITAFSITGADELTTATIGHNYIQGDLAPTISVVGAVKLGRLDLSQVQKVKTVTLTGNSALVDVVGPSATVLAEAAAPITLSTGTNSFTGVYTDGVAAVAATQTTSGSLAEDPTIASDSALSLLTWFNAAAAVSTAATSVSVDIEHIAYGSTMGALSAAISADGNSGAAAAPIANAATIAMVIAE